MPRATINGKEIFYSWKPARQAGLTLLLIHGLGGSGAFYAPVIPGLVAAGFSCLAMDTYGHGQSKYSGPTVEQDMRSIGEDAAELLLELGISIDRTVVVGHSMGGIVACEMAAVEAPAGLVILGPVCPSLDTHDAFSRRIDVVKQSGLEGIVDTIDVPGHATGAKASRVAQAFVRSLILSQTPEEYMSLCHAIADAMTPPFPMIKCPLLAIHGQDDKVAQLDDLGKMVSSWGAPSLTELDILEGVGHWHCIEDAEEVEEMIKKFAKKIASKLPQY